MKRHVVEIAKRYSVVSQVMETLRLNFAELVDEVLLKQQTASMNSLELIASLKILGTIEQ